MLLHWWDWSLRCNSETGLTTDLNGEWQFIVWPAFLIEDGWARYKGWPRNILDPCFKSWYSEIKLSDLAGLSFTSCAEWIYVLTTVVFRYWSHVCTTVLLFLSCSQYFCRLVKFLILLHISASQDMAICDACFWVISDELQAASLSSHHTAKVPVHPCNEGLICFG